MRHDYVYDVNYVYVYDYVYDYVYVMTMSMSTSHLIYFSHARGNTVLAID